MVTEKIIRIEDEIYGGYTTVSNPVSQYWDIELFLHNDHNENYIFMVKFTSKLPLELPDGRTITQSKMIREVDFEDKERTIRKELRDIGIINDIIFRGIKDYIEYLKLNKQYSFHEDIIESIDADEEPEYIKIDSSDCYETLLKEIVDNPEFFPNIDEEFEIGVSEGIIISDYKNYGYPVIAIEGVKLQDIINVVGKKEFEDVIRSWKEKGLLVSGDSKERRFTSKFTFSTKYRTNAYLIKMEQKQVEKMDKTS